MKWFKHQPILAVILSLGVILSACGKPPKKEGESCTKNGDCESKLLCLNQKCTQGIPKPELKAPQADVSGPTRVKVGSRVKIDGGKSIGYSGDPISYSWSLTAPDKSKASLSDNKTSQRTFTADVAGTYMLTLTVKDQDKESQEAKFEVEAYKDNVPPEASVTPSEVTTKAGEKVELDGSGSKDADEDSLTYAWSLKAKPDASKADLDSTDQDKTSLTPDEAGLYVVELEVTDGNGGRATTQSFITVTKAPEAPTLTSLTPAKAPTGTKTKVMLEGENFLYGATVQFDGKDVDSVDYINDKKLEVVLDLTKTTKGTYKVKVINPDEKKQETKELDFEVTEAQAPTISQVGPPLVVRGQSVRLVIDGTNFLPGAVVAFAGNDLPTDFESDKLLRATLVVPKDGTYKVVVTNPDGQKSNEYEFLVSSVTPILDAISFSRIGNDCQKESIEIRGRNLLPGVKAELVLKSDPKKTYAPTKVDYVSMTAVKLEYDFTKVPKGKYELKVTNPGSEASASTDFDVTDPIGAPKLLNVAPNTLVLGSKATVYITGLNLEGAKVTLDGKTVTMTPVNKSVFKANLDLSNASAGKMKLEVIGLCEKKATPVDVEYIAIPTPTIESSTPEVVYLDTKGNVLLRGKGFHPNSKVLSGGNAIADAVYIHSGLFQIPIKNFATPGKFDLEVENPGGKKSAKYTLKVDHVPIIESLDPSAIAVGSSGNIKINGKNFASNAKVLVNGNAINGAKIKDFDEIEIPRSAFTAAGNYDIEVENPGGLKSKKSVLKVTANATLTLVRYSISGSLTYFHGVGIRTSTFTSDSNIVVYKGTNQVFNKKGTNSSVYNDAVYLSSSSFSSLTSPPYEVQICRPIGGGTCSNKIPFIPGQDPGSSGNGPTIPKQDFIPTIASIEPLTPNSFIYAAASAPTKITFQLNGNYYESSSQVYLNGKDLSNLPNVKVVVASVGVIRIEDLPVTELIQGDNSIEVVTSVNRSNTQYLHWKSAPYMRISWSEYLQMPSDVSFRFYLYGGGLDSNAKVYSGGKILKSGTRDLGFSSFSSDVPYYLSGNSWSNSRKLTPGPADVQLQLANGTKSNTIQLRAIDPGDYGTEPLMMTSVDGDRILKDLPGAAPYVGEETLLRIGFTGFIAKAGGLGGQGKVMLDGKAITDYTAGLTSTTTSISNSYANGYTYITLKKQNLGGGPRVVPIYLENPDGTKSNEHFVTVMPAESMRLTRLENAHELYNVIRPGEENLIRVYGNKIKNAKFYLAGIPLEVDRYGGTSYEYADLKVDIPEWATGYYPLWAKKGTSITNTLMVQVRKDGIGGVPRVGAIIPLVINQTALAKTNNKVRVAFTGRGFSKTTKIYFNNKSYPIVFGSSSLSFAELDMTGLAKGKYKIYFEDDNGKLKSHEFQIEID